MATLKCKMCGGDLNIDGESTVAVCEYCGTKQTVPSADNDKKMNLYQRAHRLRFNCEFDKAAGVYESIIADFTGEAEAYWGLVLCKYGIEYVDDPASGNKVPTCHRSSFDSIFDDSDFEQVLEYADPIARGVYREEAKKIEELRKGIIEVSGKEEPYDIFICYKETDDNGNRTVDSLIAQDVYDALTDKGYRVFFSRITLEDKLGQEYEPYIFAALNSAKVMLAFGTDYEYYNSVWVKNEWSRFLQLMAKGGGEKKTLIPCYKGIDAYDIPKEFAKLQAQDMGKVGAIQDLLRGIEKLLPLENHEEANKKDSIQQIFPQAATVDTLLKRAYDYLEDRDWKNAEDYCNRVLDIVPENAHAYIGKLMAGLHVSKESDLANLSQRIDLNTNFTRATKYGDTETKQRLSRYDDAIKTRIEQEKTRIEQEKLKMQAVEGKKREIQNVITEANASLEKAKTTCESYKNKINYKTSCVIVKIEEKINKKKEETDTLKSQIGNNGILYGALIISIGVLALLTYIIIDFVKDISLNRKIGDILEGLVIGSVLLLIYIGIMGVISILYHAISKKEELKKRYKKSCLELNQLEVQYENKKASLSGEVAELNKNFTEAENEYNMLLSTYRDRLQALNNEYRILAKEANMPCEALIPAAYQ